MIQLPDSAARTAPAFDWREALAGDSVPAHDRPGS
jgi:hypothetical protein